jgi:hypothetical protein
MGADVGGSGIRKGGNGGGSSGTSSTPIFGDVTGALTNTLVMASPSVPVTAYIDGGIYIIRLDDDVPGAPTTLDISGVGAKSVVRFNTTDPETGDMPSDIDIAFIYDLNNDYFQSISLMGSEAAAVNTNIGDSDLTITPSSTPRTLTMDGGTLTILDNSVTTSPFFIIEQVNATGDTGFRILHSGASPDNHFTFFMDNDNDDGLKIRGNGSASRGFTMDESGCIAMGNASIDTSFELNLVGDVQISTINGANSFIIDGNNTEAGPKILLGKDFNNNLQSGADDQSYVEVRSDVTDAALTGAVKEGLLVTFGGNVGDHADSIISGLRLTGSVASGATQFAAIFIDSANWKFGVYQDEATVENYFAGDTGIGIDIPTAKLHVKGSGGDIIVAQNSTPLTTFSLSELGALTSTGRGTGADPTMLVQEDKTGTTSLQITNTDTTPSATAHASLELGISGKTVDKLIRLSASTGTNDQNMIFLIAETTTDGVGIQSRSVSGKIQFYFGSGVVDANIKGDWRAEGLKIGSPGIADATLHVDGDIKIVDGTEGLNKVLTSNADGLATWETPGADINTNLANDNLTLDANRTHDLNNFDLTFNSSSGSRIQMLGNATEAGAKIIMGESGTLFGGAALQQSYAQIFASSIGANAGVYKVGLSIDLDGHASDDVNSIIVGLRLETSITSPATIHAAINIGNTWKYGIYQDTSNVNNYFAGKVGIGTSTPTVQLHVNGGGAAGRQYIGSTLSANGSDVGFLSFVGDNSIAAETVYADIFGNIDDNSSTDEIGELVFRTTHSGALAQHMRLSNDGNVVIGNTTGLSDSRVIVMDSSGAVAIQLDPNKESGVVGLIEQPSGHIGSPTDKTYFFVQSAAFTYNINTLIAKTVSGTLNVAVQINGTPVTGINTLAVSSVEATGTATALNIVAIGDTVTLVVTSSSSPVDFSFTMKTTRT